MNITNQTNQNECGVCVIKSLVEHYHQQNINFTDLLNQANLSKDGLTIFDLELLGAKYGLNLESYQCELDELFDVSKKEYFIVLITENEMNHFVIAKIISKKEIEIYCSIKGVYRLSKKEFENIWNKIYIKVTKTICDFEISKHHKIDWNLINWKSFITLNVFNIAIVLFSILGSLFSQKMIELVINNKETRYILMIATSFILIFITEILFNYLIAIYSFKVSYCTYEQLHKKTFIILSHKYLNFFNKVDYGYIININQYLYNFSNFYNFKLNRIISDVILITAITIILGFINYIFILITIIFSLFFLALKIIKTKINKLQLSEIESTDAQYNNNVLNFLNFVKTNRNFNYSKYYLNQIQNVFNKTKTKAQKLLINNANINLIDQVLNILIYVLNFIICSILIINNKLALSQLIFITSIIQMFNNSIKNLTNIFYEFETLKIARKIIYDVWNVNNMKLHDGLNLNVINSIRYKNLIFYNDTLLSGKNGCGKSTILKSIASMIENADVQINELNLKNYNSEAIKSQIIYLNDEFKFNQQDIYQLMQSPYNELLANYISKLDLNNMNYDNMSLGQIQILNFFSLLNYKNKIILLDEFLNHVDQEWKQILLSEIKPIITENNFVITVDHDLKEKTSWFNYHLELHEKIY